MTPSEDWIPWQVFLFRDHSCLQLPSSYKCFSVLLSPKFTYSPPDLLDDFSDLLCCCSPLSPPPPRVCLCVYPYVRTHTHTQHSRPPPWSPCGFKVLILIRFELTYLQSSFSCSSETTGSSHQDLDLLVATGSPWNTNERPFASPAQLVSSLISCSIRRLPEQRPVWPRGPSRPGQ